MSADNWTVCPKCKVADEAKYEASQKEIAKAYGKVSAEEYLKQVQAAPKLPESHETLREDYEIGIYEGEFSVSYTGCCNICNFSFSFRQKKKV